MIDLHHVSPIHAIGSGSQSFNDLACVAHAFKLREDMVKIDHVFSPILTVNGKFLHDTNPTTRLGGFLPACPQWHRQYFHSTRRAPVQHRRHLHSQHEIPD